MKKVLLLLVCVMASMTTMGLKAQDGAKPLSQGQWNHGLAVGAQWIATDLGFAQAEDKVISRTNENYTLDDLRVLYGSKAKWVTYYDKLKAHENEGGDMDKLLATIAGEYEKGAVLKNGVKRDVEKYNASHTGDEVGATPAGEPAPATAQAGNATVVNNADSTAATAQNAQENNAEEKKEDGGHSGHGFLYLLTILGLALGAIGTFLAMQARKENQAIMHDLNDDIKNMQKQLDKMRSTLKGQGEAEHRPHKPAGKHDNCPAAARPSSQPKLRQLSAITDKNPNAKSPRKSSPWQLRKSQRTPLESHASCSWQSPTRMTISLARQLPTSLATQSLSSPPWTARVARSLSSTRKKCTNWHCSCLAMPSLALARATTFSQLPASHASLPTALVAHNSKTASGTL